jgi:hypothetical protein
VSVKGKSVEEFALEVSEFADELASIGKSAPRVMARALNRAQTAGSTAMSRAVVKDTGIAAKYVKRQASVRVDKATASNHVVAITFTGKKIPLIAFGARGPEPSRGRGRGVSYTMFGERKRDQNAFIATVKAGSEGSHRGVFIRKNKDRLPIRERMGPAIPDIMKKFVPLFHQKAQESLRRTLEHDIAFEQKKQQSNAVE